MNAMLLLGLLCAGHAYAATAKPEDGAVIAVLRQSDPALRKFQVLRRTSITDQLDVVLILGGDRWGTLADGSVPWGEREKLGLFLQDRHDPGRVYLIDIAKGEPDCWARVARVTQTDAVVSCTGEKSQRQRYRKFIYDARAKALVRQYRYAPFSARRIFPRRDGAIFIEGHDETLLAIEYATDREPAFRVLSEPEARPWIVRFQATAVTKPAPAPAAIPALPRTTYDQFAAARPERVKNGYVRAGTEIHDAIGPWQLDNGRIWFGKSFYDGEGDTGVGGFGYFDAHEHKLQMFEPPEIADWSVTAMVVGPQAVWIGLAWLGEGSSLSGGLLRFDRETKTVRRFEFPDFAQGMTQFQDQILIASDFGIGIVKDQRVSRYFVDQMSDGRYRVVEANE